MSQATCYASLAGLLSIEAQRLGRPPGEANTQARALWHQAADAPQPETKDLVALPVLDTASINRLRDLIADQFSDSVAALWSAPPRAESVREPGARDVHDAQADLFQELLADTVAKLKILNDKPEETADRSLRALWQTAAGTPMSAEQAAESALPELDAPAILRLRALLAERLSGVPLAHLTGRQRFMGLELATSRAALVPRKETELLGHVALAVLRQLAGVQQTLRVIDVCTGAGNLALALASQVPTAQVFASDLSAEAVTLARGNGALLQLGNRVVFRQGDFLEPFTDGDFDHNVDLLVCNPPYISSGKVGTLPGEIIGHEPSLAFDGGPFGVKILQRLISEAPQFLRQGGWLAFEVGLGQGPVLMERLRRNAAYADVTAVVDVTGAVRALLARVP